MAHQLALVSAFKDVLAKFIAFQGFAAFRVLDNCRATSAELVDDFLALGTVSEVAIIVALMAAVQCFIAAPMAFGMLSSAQNRRKSDF